MLEFGDSEHWMCPECGSTDTITTSSGRTICAGCAVELEVEYTRENPRAYNKTQVDKRVHTQPLGNSFLSQLLGGFEGSKISYSSDPKYQWLRKLDSQSFRGLEKSLRSADEEFKKLAGHLGIGRELMNCCEKFYFEGLKKADEKGMAYVKGRSFPNMVAACTYLALRKSGNNRTLKDLVSCSTASKREISRCIRYLQLDLGLDAERSAVSEVLSLISKLAQELNKTGCPERVANYLCRKSEKLGIITGKNPMSLAAAYIYIGCAVCKDNETQQRIADAAGTTPVTIRNRYNEIIKKLGIYSTVKDNVKKGAGMKPGTLGIEEKKYGMENLEGIINNLEKEIEQRIAVSSKNLHDYSAPVTQD